MYLIIIKSVLLYVGNFYTNIIIYLYIKISIYPPMFVKTIRTFNFRMTTYVSNYKLLKNIFLGKLTLFELLTPINILRVINIEI